MCRLGWETNNAGGGSLLVPILHTQALLVPTTILTQ